MSHTQTGTDRFVFFGGKGGVGKTTVSSAYAVKLSQTGVNTLLVSTDPAHSTSDVFDQAFTNEPSPVDGYENLWAMEVDPAEELREHMMEIKRAMNDQVSATIVNELDRHIELAHQTPGAHEAAIFDRIIDIMREFDEYDRIVFDTSPTGSTLRLLSLPEHLEGWIQRLSEKRKRSLRLFELSALGEKRAAAEERTRTDPIITRLRERKEMFEFAGEVLRTDAAFFLVMNPDNLSIKETARSVTTLTDHGLFIDGLVINKITPSPDTVGSEDTRTYLQEKHDTEQERVQTILDTFEEPVVARIETRTEEVTGDRLDEVVAELDFVVEADPPA